ncbi:Glucan 1,3-beta-glucosidase [Cercospora zeina]
MRVSTSLAALVVVAAQQCAAYYKGFNVGANNPDGSCKTREQWEEAFSKLRGLPQDMNTVRLYASSDCNTLANAVPAAQNTGTQILVGIWTEDAAHFGAEKAALESAINTYGYDWILAISVGSEDLYRGDTDANTLAQQIYDVRGMVRAMGVEAEVGHVDTWNAFTDSANDAVIHACDFVGLDAYPYWEGGSIDEAYDLFFTAYQVTKDHVQSIGSGAWVWVTETSWPVTGDTFGNAVPSVANAQKFWRSVACELFNEGHVFWYAYQDYNDSPSFGIFDSNGNAVYDLLLMRRPSTMALDQPAVAPATPAQPATLTCSFLDKLSAELRVQIYGHVFGDAGHVQPVASYRCKQYDHREEGNESIEDFAEPPVIETSIMAANKQIHGEAVETFCNKKTIRMTFAQLGVALCALESGSSRSMNKTRYLELARYIEIVECKSARRNSVHKCFSRLHLLPRLKSLTILTEFLTAVGGAHNHWTAQQWVSRMDLPGLVCIDVGKFEFENESKLAKVQLVNSKLARMWPHVKSTPDDYDVVKVIDKIFAEWAISGPVSNLLALASHTSLRLWVALHEILVALLAEEEADGGARWRELDFDSSEYIRVSTVFQWARSTIQGFAPLRHWTNRPTDGIPMRALGPGHGSARLGAATELLAMNIASYHVRDEYHVEDMVINMIYGRPSWPELGEVDIGAKCSREQRIAREWMLNNACLDVPWDPNHRYGISRIPDALSSDLIFGKVYGEEQIRNADKGTLQEMMYFYLAINCGVVGVAGDQDNEGGWGGPQHVAWATSHLRKYLELGNHFLPAEKRFAAAEIEAASLETLQQIFKLATTMLLAHIESGEQEEPEPIEMTGEMQQEEDIYWPYLSKVAGSLRGYYALIRLIQRPSNEVKQESGEVKQERSEVQQESDRINHESDEKKTDV